MALPLVRKLAIYRRKTIHKWTSYFRYESHGISISRAVVKKYQWKTMGETEAVLGGQQDKAKLAGWHDEAILFFFRFGLWYNSHCFIPFSSPTFIFKKQNLKHFLTNYFNALFILFQIQILASLLFLSSYNIRKQHKAGLIKMDSSQDPPSHMVDPFASLIRCLHF